MAFPPIEIKPDGSAHGATMSQPLRVEGAKVIASYYSPEALKDLLERAKNAGITPEEQQALDLADIASW